MAEGSNLYNQEISRSWLVLWRIYDHFIVVKLPRCVGGIAGGPVTDWHMYEVVYGKRYMDRPGENEEGYEMTNLSNKANQLDARLMMIHGTVDDVVVMQHSMQLVQAFVEAGKRVDFMPYPMHHNVRGKDRVHLMQTILDYLSSNIDR